MELSARELAKYINDEVPLPEMDAAGYTQKTQTVSSLGDIAEMLKLPENQQLYKKQQVTIQQAQDADGEPIYPTRDADILLLGDSFSNIYSFAVMNWGEAAGFGEQLSYYLQRPFDAIINNAGGSHVTRQQLVRELARGKDRLRGKRLVIWQFAMRDLLIGDWKVLELPVAKKQP
jgi:alginate O-acetyltransferase complex protein AlgJ